MRILPTAKALFLLTLISIGLVGCITGSPPKVPIESTEITTRYPIAWPTFPHVRALDAEAANITIRVYSGGRLAKLGHNHVITANRVYGLIKLHPDITKSSFILIISVADLKVDQAEARAKAGPDFVKPVKEKDILGTSRNMLGPKVLDAENFPFIEITTRRLWGSPPLIYAELAITIKQVTKRITTEIHLALENEVVVASGQLILSQRDFGIEPYQILGGAIAVADSLPVNYQFYLPLNQTDH
ncbi:MAG: YceI family protein [Pseudomonadales bacterium]|nr:YceI family protein [Pseudomonadales bacterium]